MFDLDFYLENLTLVEWLIWRLRNDTMLCGALILLAILGLGILAGGRVEKGRHLVLLLTLLLLSSCTIQVVRPGVPVKDLMFEMYVNNTLECGVEYTLASRTEILKIGEIRPGQRIVVGYYPPGHYRIVFVTMDLERDVLVYNTSISPSEAHIGKPHGIVLFDSEEVEKNLNNKV